MSDSSSGTHPHPHVPKSPGRLVHLAAVVGLIALLMMAVAVVYPVPVTVLAAMMIGQALGAFAFLCYLGAIVLEMRRKAGTPPKGS